MRTLSRTQAIAELRTELLKLVDADHSLCAVAARRGLFCNGLGRFDTAELQKCLPGAGSSEPAAERAAVEREVNQWLASLQDVSTERLPCDHPGRSSLCAGWEEFFEAELARFYLEMLGEEVRVVPDSLLLPDVI
jgi:hypothetical protein